jgi:hypothetical protein
MPRFYIKKGLATPELKEWIATNKDEPFLRVDIEIESDHERLRRSFHVLLKAWFNSGEWSCNGSEINSLEKFKDYYKFAGCDFKANGYIYKGDRFDTLEKLHEAYDYVVVKEFIRPEVKSWTKMSKKEKSSCIDLLLTEIKLSYTNNQEVLNWVDKISGDYELLRGKK